MTSPDAVPAQPESPATPPGACSPSSSCCPPPPPLPDSGPSGLGCLGCAILLVLLILVAWWLLPARAVSFDARAHVPATALVYVESRDVAPLATGAGQLTLWKDGQGPDALKTMRDSLASLLASELGDVRRRDVNDLIDLTAGFALAVAPGHKGELAWLGVFHMRDIEQARRILKEDLWTRIAETTVAGEKVANIQRADGSVLWHRIAGQSLIVTPDEELLRFLITCDQKAEPTLADLPVFQNGLADAQLTALFDIRSLRRRQLDQGIAARAIQSLLGMQPLLATLLPEEQVERMDPDARLVCSLAAREGQRCSLDLLVTGTAIPPRTHGFFYYAAWIVLTPIALIILTVLTIVLITLLMAAYFYVVAWWRGELSPPEVPPGAPLSPELKQDLGAKPGAERSRE